jgi:tetratricopeptide (TPR) repeat protein
VSNEIPAKAAGTGSVGQRLPSWFNRDWHWELILVLAVILTYSPVWWAGYIWDDDLYVTANPVIIGPLGLKEIWTTRAADICPLTVSTFWVEHALWGLDPLPYHLVNVLLHGACAVLLWRVLRSLQIPGAWLGAALWALHPVQVESVAWITEMKNTQSGLFFLLSILFFARWLRAGNLDGRTGGGWNYALTLLFAALAMASKSSAVILPVILCLCAWWMEGRWQWRNLVKVVPVFLLSVAATALSMWTLGMQLATVSDPQLVRTWPERLVTAGDAVWFYLGKLLWPHPLITIYPRWQIDAGQGFSYLPLLAVILILVILWLKRESWSRPWLFVFAYFLVALLPTLGLLNNPIFRYSLVFDHFQYLASMGPLALAGAGLTRYSDIVLPGKQWLQTIICAGLLLILGALSWQRAWVYQSEETLWTDTLAQNPNCWVGYNNLGHFLLQHGQVDGAFAQFQKALEINPNYAEAHNNLGIALEKKGRIVEAMEQYDQALNLMPNCADAAYNLGFALFQKGQVDAAIAQLQKALKIQPNYPEALSKLGIALFQKGQVNEGIAQFQKALEIDPDYAVAHYNLGIALVQMGQLDAAIAQLQEAVRLNPADNDAQNALAKMKLMATQRASQK